MPSDTHVAKWGNSLAIRIPRSVAKDAHIAEGDRLSLDVARDGSLILRAARHKYSLEELVKGIGKRNLHRESKWGPTAGKESW